MTSTIETDEISAADGSRTDLVALDRHGCVRGAPSDCSGSCVRWLVLRSSAGVLTADEAYTGIQSFEIVGGQFPIVLGGTAYTLPLEAYLYAPVAALVGTDVVVLKLLSTVSWALASVALYVVARAAVESPHGARSPAALCWLTPGALLLISVTAYSAYASGMLVTVGAFVLAAMVVDADEPDRWLVVGFGVLAGFGFWLHPMFLATLVPMVLVVLWMHRRRLDVWFAVDRRRHRRMRAAPAVEREERVAVARDARAGRGHVSASGSARSART